MYSPTLSLTSALDGLGGQRQAPVDLPPGKTQYPMYRRLGGSVWMCTENLALTGTRPPDRPARSESLYRLRYPGGGMRVPVEKPAPLPLRQTRTPHGHLPGIEPGVLQWEASSWHHSLDQERHASYFEQRRDFKLPPRSIRELRSCGLLRSEWC
jgi:hypothetical protein